MTMWLAALAGFSIGMAGLLAVAMGTAYRDLPLSWTARLGGGVMLAGLAHTAWHHIGFAALVDSAPAPIYGWGLFCNRSVSICCCAGCCNWLACRIGWMGCWWPPCSAWPR
ncbi:MAG: hypothetical protein IPP28_06735 [Xanthomonadales bacterium]|nr:hypothetical protein [Xanthomonadales bacterium]